MNTTHAMKMTVNTAAPIALRFSPARRADQERPAVVAYPSRRSRARRYPGIASSSNHSQVRSSGDARSEHSAERK